MIAKTFVDSNILVYAHDLDAGDRHRRAADCLTSLWGAGGGLLSTQVLQEFYVNVTRKIRSPLAPAMAREVVRAYAPWVQTWITGETVVRASEIGEVWHLSFWDSLILAAAEQSQAVELLTEDLNHGQVIAGIQVVNPFLLGLPPT